MAALDPGAPTSKAVAEWAAKMRCAFLGLRGWMQQDWGALEAAAETFAAEQREVERLAGLNIDVGQIRLAADRHVANLAMLTGSPERIEALLEANPERAPSERAYLRLRWAGAVRERTRRAGTGPEPARAALTAAMEEALEPIDRVSCALWLADLELDAGQPARARELWSTAGQHLEARAGDGARAHRRWVGLGARLAESREEQERWRTAVAEEIEAYLGEWRGLESREGGYGLFHVDDALILFCEWTRLSLALDGPELGAQHALETLARAQTETVLARRLSAAAPTLEDVRAALCPAPGQGVLAYLIGPSRSWAFALDQSGLAAVPLPGYPSIEGPRARLVTALLASGGAWDEAGRAAARELTAALLPLELQERLARWRSLAVCGLDLLLGDVPFELLELGQGRRVGLELGLWNLPSLPAGVALARRAASAAWVAPEVLLVAAPEHNPDSSSPDPAPLFELEPPRVEQLLAPYPADRRQVRLGPRASAAAFEEGQPSVVHVVAHGAFDPALPGGAELLLAPMGPEDDGRFSSADVERVWSSRAAPRLVALSACRASRGVTRRGDWGASGLAGAFLAQGVQAVVASPYDLDLDLACALGSAMHAALARGADAAEALRHARAELAADPDFAPSAQPLLTRAFGIAPAPFEPWIGDDEDDAGTLPWLALPVLLVALLALGWRRAVRGPARPPARSRARA